MAESICQLITNASVDANVGLINLGGLSNVVMQQSTPNQTSISRFGFQFYLYVRDSSFFLGWKSLIGECLTCY